MEETLTVFIDNLSEGTSLGSLWRFFQPFGRIVNVHRPMKRRIPTNTCYAFVGLESIEQARNAISGTNDRLLDGARVKTQFARPLRKQRRAGFHHPYKRAGFPLQSSQPQQQATHSSIRPQSNDGQEEPRMESPKEEDEARGGTIYLFPSGLTIPLLDRSVSVISQARTTMDHVRESLAMGNEVEHVMSVSACEFIVVFRNLEERQTFLDSRKWNAEEWSIEIWQEARPKPNRVGNVIIRGIPPQAWSTNSVNVILKEFGEIMEIETDMRHVPVNFEVCATIKTHISKIINEEVDVTFDNIRSTVGVIEVWSDEIGEKVATMQKEDVPTSESMPVAQNENGKENEKEMSQHDSAASPVVSSETEGGVDPDLVTQRVAEGVQREETSSEVNLDKVRCQCSKSDMFNLSIEIPGVGTLTLALAKVPPVSFWNLVGRNAFFNLVQQISGWGSVIRPPQLMVQKEYSLSVLEFEVNPLLKESGRPDYDIISTATCDSQLENFSAVCESPPVSVDTSPNQEEDDSIASWIGIRTCPNQGRPTPIEGNSLPAISLQVDLSLETKSKQSSKCPKPQRKKRKKTRTKISAEARECFKYGQRLRIHSPYPLRSLANIDRILRSSGNRN